MCKTALMDAAAPLVSAPFHRMSVSPAIHKRSLSSMGSSVHSVPCISTLLVSATLSSKSMQVTSKECSATPTSSQTQPSTGGSLPFSYSTSNSSTYLQTSTKDLTVFQGTSWPQVKKRTTTLRIGSTAHYRLALGW